MNIHDLPTVRTRCHAATGGRLEITAATASPPGWHGGAMHVQPVDPRDTRWEVGRPYYRVYFWRQFAGGPDAGWASEEWQVEDADIQEVIAWANSDEMHRIYTIYVCCTCDGVPGLIRLYGSGPTARG